MSAIILVGLGELVDILHLELKLKAYMDMMLFLHLRGEESNSFNMGKQEFKDLPLEHDILSFIRDLGNTRDITYLIDLNVDYLHQPWREFSTIINKCLSGKETGITRFVYLVLKFFGVNKGTKIKTKAKVAKSDKKKQPTKKPKAKGLAVLSKIALTKAEQLKLATKRSKKDFHISHASGSGDGVDIESKVPAEHQQNTSGTDEGTDSDEEDDDENDFEDDDDDNNDSDDINKSDDERTKSDRDEIPDPNLANIHDIENNDEEEEDEVTKELYDDVNVNLRNDDIEMINADQGASKQLNASQLSRFEQEEEDAHVTLTSILDTQKTGADNEIASLMDTTAYHATTIPKITLSFATPTPSPPSFFNPSQQEATPTPTPTTSEATTSFSFLSDFASVFKFNERVTNLEKYIEEAQAEKREYIELVDSTVRTIIKEEVNAQLPQMLPQAILDVATLAAVTLSEFELTKILIDKIKKNKSFYVANYKRELYDALVKSYNTKKDIFESYGEVFSLKRSRDDKDKDQDPSTGLDRGTKRRKSSKDAESSKYSRSKEKKSSSIQQDQEFVTRDNDEQPADKEVTKADWFKKPKRPPTPDSD
nr:hypothetical protein [Tanacetum cinerariifolium]